MAYGNYGGGNRYGNSGYQSRNYQAPAPQPKPQFDLDKYIEDYIDVYKVFEAKLTGAGIELPADTIARWVTSAKIAMDK